MAVKIRRAEIRGTEYQLKADNAVNAEKLGVDDVGIDAGSSTQPVYFADGIPTPLSGSVGGGTQPVYQSSGKLVASTSTVGSTSTPVYLSSGKITTATSVTAAKLGTSSVGSGTNPIYLSSGTAKASTSTVGSSVNPVYLDAGKITATEGWPVTWDEVFNGSMTISSSAKTIPDVSRYHCFVCRIADSYFNDDDDTPYLIATLTRGSATTLKGIAIDVGDTSSDNTTVWQYFIELEVADNTELSVSNILRVKMSPSGGVQFYRSTKLKLMWLVGVW